MQLGYEELFMSSFTSYKNSVLDGVIYEPSQTEKYEISFEVRGIRRIIIDYTMGNIPRIDD